MSHVLPSPATVEDVSSGGTGLDASDNRDGFLARPVPFAETLRQMGRPRGWGVIGNKRPKRIDAERKAPHLS